MTRSPSVWAPLLALGVLAVAPASFASCTYPHAPTQIPDGATATKDEMIAAQKEVKQFMTDMDAYLKCIDAENPPAPTAGLSDSQKKEQDSRERVRLQKHNAAVSDEESVADRFNVQLHVYNDKQKR
jgi:hypothetical protein